MALGKTFLSLMAAEKMVSAAGNVAAGREAKGLAEQEASQIEEASALNRQLARERIKRNIGTNLAQAGEGGSIGRSTLMSIQDNIALQQFQADIDQFNSRKKASVVRRQGELSQRESFRAAFGNVLSAGATLGASKFDFKTKKKSSGSSFGNLNVNVPQRGISFVEE